MKIKGLTLIVLLLITFTTTIYAFNSFEDFSKLRVSFFFNT